MLLSLSESQKIGIGIAMFGLFFIMMGVFAMFDSSLLAMGDILFIVGAIMFITLKKVVGFVKGRPMGSICFTVGVFLVLRKWAKIGILLQFFGFLNLFGNFFQYLPVVGGLFGGKGVGSFLPLCVG